MQIWPQIWPQIGNNLLQPPQPTAPTIQPPQANTNLFTPATVWGTTIWPQIWPSMVWDLQNIQNEPKYKQAFDQQILQTQAKEIKDVTQIASQPTRTQGLIPDFLAPKWFMTKREQKLADTYYDSPRLYQWIMETMTSGQTQQQLTPYEQIIIRDLQAAIDNGLQPTPEEIMKAVPWIPRNVAFAIAKQEDKAPPMVQALNTIKQKYQQYKDAFNPLTPARQATQKLTWKSTLDFVDPTFKFKPIEKIEQDLTQAWVSEFFAKQLSSPIFSAENIARFVGNLPSALANMAIFWTNLFLDPETTVSEFMQWMSQIPAAISEEIPFYATPAEKVKWFVDSIAKFVVENPDVILAPESLIKWSKLVRWITKSPVWPWWAADVTIQAEVARRMKAQWLAPTVENIQKTANQLYDEMMSWSYTPEWWVPETATTTTTESARQPSTVYEWTIQWSEDIVPRPQVDYRETIPWVDKEIQEVFGQTIVWVKKPADVVKKTDQQISTIENVLDNRDNLPMIFDDQWKIWSDFSVMRFAEWVSQTMDDFWQNVISPVEQWLQDLNVRPEMKDISYAIESINKSLEDMKIAWEITPIARKAYDALQEYKMILWSENLTASDLWKLSKELNAATKQLYNGWNLSPSALRTQTELAGLNVIVREIFEKVVDNMLDVPELKSLKKQRWDMRGSIKQITKRWQVLDRRVPLSLTDTLWSAWGWSEVIAWVVTQNPAPVIKWLWIKSIVAYIKNLNNPNKKLSKLIKKIDKQRDWFKVPWWFSEWSPVSESIASKVQSQVSKKKAEAAAEKSRQQIQREFVRRMKELETPALVVGGIEIMPDWTIKQQAVAPKPKWKTVIEIDTVSPAKEQAKIREMEQAELAKQNEIKERKQQEEIEKKKQEEQEAIERKKKYEEYKADLAKKMVEEQEKMAFEMLYEKAKSEWEVVQWADIFWWLQKWDVTPIGIVESTYVSGTKPIVEIKWEKFNPWETRVYNQEVFRLPWDAEKRLDRNKIMIKDSLDETKTSPTDELSSFIEDMKQLNPETNYEVPQKELDNIQSREFMYDLMRKEDPKYQYFVNKAAQLAHMEQRLWYVWKNKIKVWSIRNDQEIEFLKRKENLLIELMDEYTNLDQVWAEEQLQRYMDAPVSHVTRQPKTSSYVSVAEKQQRALQRAEKFKRKVSEPEANAEVAVAEKPKETIMLDKTKPTDLMTEANKGWVVDQNKFPEIKEKAVDTQVEILPDDVSIYDEAKKTWAKRISPDRVAHQQLTPEEWIQRIIDKKTKNAQRNYDAFSNYRKQILELKDKYWEKFPTRLQAEKLWIKTYSEDRTIWDQIQRNLVWQKTGNFDNAAATMKRKMEHRKYVLDKNDYFNETSKKEYIDSVRSDISRWYQYPKEVIDYDKSFSVAVDSRARYQKWLDTSFSVDDSRIVFDDKDKIWAWMKRQDWKIITEENKADIVEWITDFADTLWLDMKKLAENERWVYVHLNGKNPFLMKKTAGLYRKSWDNISISVWWSESYDTVEWGEKVVKKVKTTMSHELWHAIDYQTDNKLFSSSELYSRKYDMNTPPAWWIWNKYWRSDKEITARMIEQYVAIEKQWLTNYYDKPAYWNKQIYNNSIKPAVEEAIKKHFSEYMKK